MLFRKLNQIQREILYYLGSHVHTSSRGVVVESIERWAITKSLTPMTYKLKNRKLHGQWRWIHIEIRNLESRGFLVCLDDRVGLTDRGYDFIRFWKNK